MFLPCSIRGDYSFRLSSRYSNNGKADLEATPQLSTARARTRLRGLLCLNCVLTDFSHFILVFTVTRQLAERHAEQWLLGVIGGGLSFAAAVASLVAGWLGSRANVRTVFISGAGAIVLSVAACLASDSSSAWFLPCYWLSGIGLGLIYPPLIGWLNQGDDPHANHQGVSRRLIIFCIAWNAGMMSGQLSGGSLFEQGAEWALRAAFAAASINLAVSLVAARQTGYIPAGVPGPVQTRPALSVLASAYKRLSWIANLGGVFGASLIIHLLPAVMTEMNIAAASHGRLLFGWRGVIIATYIVMHCVGFWHYRLSVSLASQVLGAVGLVVIAQAESAAMLLVGLALQGQLVGFNYFSGLYYSTAGSSDEGRTLAAGIHEATLATGMATGTIVGGVFGSWINHRLPYLLAAGVIVVLIIAQSLAWWRWVRPLSSQRET